MSEELIRTLITVAGPLLGAALGGLWAWLASGRTARATVATAKTALEQARYARVNERQDEILATIFTQLYDLHDGLFDMIRDPGPPQEKLLAVKHLFEKLNEASDYHRRHQLWLSTTSTMEISVLITLYGRQFGRFADVAQEPNTPQYNDTVNEIRQWALNDLQVTLQRLRVRFQKVLGVEEQD